MKNKLLLFLGLFLIIIFYWAVFVYIRPSRDIPFPLDILRLGILLWIITLYSIFLYKSFKNTSATRLKLPEVIMQFFTLIREALSLVDQNLKYPIRVYYDKFFSFIACKIQLNDVTFWARVIFAFTLIPRIILITVFFIDVFYFHQLFYFFKVLWISILLFFPQYIIYCFLDVSESLISYLDKNLKSISTTYVYGVLPPEEDYWNDAYIYDKDEPDEEPPHEMYLTVRKFFAYKYSCILFNKYVENTFFCSPTSECYNNFENSQNMPKNMMSSEEQADILYNNLTDKANTVISIYKMALFFIQLQENNMRNKNMTYAFTLIAYFYFLSWSYILLISIYNVSISEALEMLKILTPNIIQYNPFENP